MGALRAVDVLVAVLAGGRLRALLLPAPLPELRPLDLEEAVWFAIPHTVVGSRHISHSRHTDHARETHR
jgi:hypothetical protein